MYPSTFAALGFEPAAPVGVPLHGPDTAQTLDLPPFLTVGTLKRRHIGPAKQWPAAKQRIFFLRDTETPLCDSTTLHAENIAEIILADEEVDDHDEESFHDCAIVRYRTATSTSCPTCGVCHYNEQRLCERCMAVAAAEWLEPMEDQEETAAVYQLNCAKCKNHRVTFRGMCVALCADTSTHLFSTDFVTDRVVERGEQRKIDTCDCQIVDIYCANCDCTGRSDAIGYHVTCPCAGCLSSSNNGRPAMSLVDQLNCAFVGRPLLAVS